MAPLKIIKAISLFLIH